MPNSNHHRFERFEATRLTAALQVVPALHSCTLQIETLVDQVWREAQGTVTPKDKDLRKWCASLRGSATAQAEDPREDAFLGRLTRPFEFEANVFLGRVSYADRTLEDLIISMLNCHRVSSDSPLFIQCTGLVMLSTIIAGRLGLTPESEIAEARRLEVPQWRYLKPAMDALTFTATELEEAGLNPEVLSDLVAGEPEPKHVWETIDERGASEQLVRRPLIASGDERYLYALPCRCLDTVLALIVGTLEPNDLSDFSTLLAELQFDRHLISRADDLRIAQRSFKEAPIFNDIVQAEVGLIDGDIAIHVVGVRGYFPNSASGPQSHIATTPDGLVDYLTESREWVAEATGAGKVLSLFVICGIPSGFSAPLPEPSEGRICNAILIHDLATIADSRVGLLDLLHSLEHEDDLFEAGIRVMNWAGPVNFHAYRTSCGTDLFPMGDSTAEHRMLIIDSAYVGEWRSEVRSCTDRRVFHHPLLERSVEAVRWRIEPDLPSEELRRIYRTEPAPRGGEEKCLDRIISEGQNGLLWFAQADEEPQLDHELRGFLRPVFEMMVLWIGEAWCDLEASGEGGQLEIALRFDPDCMGRWEMSWNVEKQLDVRISKLGLEAFHAPNNAPEREFIDSILEVMGEVLPEPLHSLLAELIARAQANSSARHVHRTISNEAACWVGADVRESCYWPSERTRKLFRWRTVVRDLSLNGFHCEEGNYREALNQLVETLWTSIENDLSKYHLPSFISSCMRALTKARFDMVGLDLSTGALLAIHQEDNKGAARIRSWREGLQAGPKAIRTLAEIGAYSCSRESGRSVVGNDKLMQLMIKADLFIEASHIRFGVFQGHIDPDVAFDSEGQLNFDAGQLGKLLAAYTDRTYSEWDLGNVSTYESQIGSYPDDQSQTDGACEENNDFEAAFAAEFGLALDDLWSSLSQLENHAVKSGSSAVLMLTPSVLREVTGLSKHASTAFVDSFSLPLRSGRYEDIVCPRGTSEVDPWLDRRQLSLLARPMVPVSKEEGAALLVPIGLLRSGIALRIGQWKSGQIDANAARSSEMKKYLGGAKRQWGLAFELAVVERLEAGGFSCLQGKQMTFYGAPKNPNLGDLDILAWHPNRSDILAIECKNLVQPKNLADVVSALREFSGSSDDSKDSLSKHLRRMEWLRTNWEIVQKNAKSDHKAEALKSILLFNAPSPVGLGNSTALEVSRTEVFHTREFIDTFCKDGEK